MVLHILVGLDFFLTLYKLYYGFKNLYFYFQLNDTEQESLQDKSMVLFRFLQEKDVFERWDFLKYV